MQEPSIPPNLEYGRGMAKLIIGVATEEAIAKHGPLKGGMARWIHHLEEECDEAVMEMRTIELLQKDGSIDRNSEYKSRLLAELAQVAQLAETMMVMLIEGREREGEETWQSPK